MKENGKDGNTCKQQQRYHQQQLNEEKENKEEEGIQRSWHKYLLPRRVARRPHPHGHSVMQGGEVCFQSRHREKKKSEQGERKECIG